MQIRKAAITVAGVTMLAGGLATIGSAQASTFHQNHTIIHGALRLSAKAKTTCVPTTTTYPIGHITYVQPVKSRKQRHITPKSTKHSFALSTQR